MKPPCMTDDEWTDWLAADAQTERPGEDDPCRDCTRTFRAAMRRVGLCSYVAKPRPVHNLRVPARGNRYATDTERIDARRRTHREAARRRRIDAMMRRVLVAA